MTLQVLGSWCLPPLGIAAEARMPNWLLEAVSNGKILFSHLGGLAMSEGASGDEALPGDSVLLMSNFEIQFRPNSTRS